MNGHYSDLDQRRNGILLTHTNNKENGTEWLNKMLMEFSESGHPVFRATIHCPEERSKANLVENCQYTFALTRERVQLFFAQLFLLISPVFTEQSQICVKNVKPGMLETGDLLWQDNLTHCLCRQVR